MQRPLRSLPLSATAHRRWHVRRQPSPALFRRCMLPLLLASHQAQAGQQILAPIRLADPPRRRRRCRCPPCRHPEHPRRARADSHPRCRRHSRCSLHRRRCAGKLEHVLLHTHSCLPCLRRGRGVGFARLSCCTLPCARALSDAAPLCRAVLRLPEVDDGSRDECAQVGWNAPTRRGVTRLMLLEGL